MSGRVDFAALLLFLFLLKIARDKLADVICDVLCLFALMNACMDGWTNHKWLFPASGSGSGAGKADLIA
jgi:hypothetical protein